MKKVIKALKYDQVSYYEEEVGQPEKIEISSSLIDLGLKNKTIALKYHMSMGGCANSYSSDNLILIMPQKDSFVEILKPFYLNRTIYQGGCNGNYTLEKQNSEIEITQNNENKYDLKILTKIKYEDNIEKSYSKNSKSVIRLIQANESNKYEIKELPYFFYEN